MKVEVLTIKDVKIKKWRWYSDWIDIAVFDYSGGYLMQMKISRNNSKKFRAISFVSKWNSCSVTTASAGNLTDINEK